MIASLPANGAVGSGGPVSRVSRGLALHRSNSSLELPHSPDSASRIPDAPLRREYGSHGSIDVVAQSVSVGENLFAMLQDLRAPDQRNSSPGDFLRRVQDCQSVATDIDEVYGPATGSSPKLRLKLNRLWGGKPPRVTTAEDSCSNSVVSADIEERHRRRAFAHYDCQSLTANLGYAAKLRGILLARRRNTATGASAASSARASTPDEAPPEDDVGDGKGNDLLESCPFFRNEIGGEGERDVGLTRCPNANGVHRPPLAYGVSVLEPPPGETLWKQRTCPLQRGPLPIESVDEGAHYYRRYFLGQEHQNWFGMDEQLGPVAISIRKDGSQYRIIVRTSELLTLRGSVPEEALGARSQAGGRPPTRELLELVAPEVQLSCLRLGIPGAEEAVARLDEQGLSNKYKVGVLYGRSGQRSEEEMYNNQHAGPAFLEFLDTIGQRIRLRGFEGYKAGLDTRTDSTGTHAIAATHMASEVTFHVSTMLPFTPNNRQQLLRKRHIGNDIVTIVFQDPGALPFSPRRIRSQFQHVFIIVRAIDPCTENTRYSVAVSRSKEVPIFGPPIPPGATFSRGKAFADFILAKVINAENAAHRSEKFATMATRTRQEYLKDLATNYCSAMVIDTGQKFSMLSFSSKKKALVRPSRLLCDASQRGAICWQVIVEDGNQNTDCYLGVSVDTIVLVEEHSRQIIFVTPCIGVLGWYAQTNSLRLYHHQGECITVHVRGDYGERDELMEIVARLRAVTQGSPASELSLRRNSLGQLGFHVQPDGVVTQVEGMGLSWQAGLRQGSRLVEICKVAVSTLSHDQMVDLLKTSAQVTVTVIPPTNDGSPRRGCTLQNCQYLANGYDGGDYENVTNPDNTPSQQTAMSRQKRRYDRSFSPPRSSNSSGYGTGSSSRSFNDPRFPLEGTMTSSSSGHSSADDRWYELLEPQDQHQYQQQQQQQQEFGHRGEGISPPPPLPARQGYQPIIIPGRSTGPLKSKEKETHCVNGTGAKREYSEDARRCNNHEQYSKESNYISSRAVLDSVVKYESNYQAPDNGQIRNLDVVSSNYVRLQKGKYEVRQEILYPKIEPTPPPPPPPPLPPPTTMTTQAPHNGDNNTTRRNNLGPSASLPLTQNVSCGLLKSSSNNNLVRFVSDYSEQEVASDRSNMRRESCEANKATADRHDKFEFYEEQICDRKLLSGRYEQNGGERRFVNTYEVPPDGRSCKYEFDATRNAVSNLTESGVDRKLETGQGVDASHDTTCYETQHEFKVGEKVTCLKTAMTERPAPRKVNLEFRSKDLTSCSLPPEMRVIDANSTDISTLPSEDELSNESGNVSPKLRRANRHRGGNLTPSNGNSRNQSPRPKQGTRSSHRNSANLTSSTLQEDLMKLINPDYITDDGGQLSSNNNLQPSNIVAGTNISSTNKSSNNNTIEIQNRCRSRENLCGNSTSTLSVLPSANGQENGNDVSEVILTMARPATVISNTSTASSPAPSENKLSKEERLSPRVTKPTAHSTAKSMSNLVTDNRDAKKLQSEGETEWTSHADSNNLRATKQEWSDERLVDGTCTALTNSVSDLQTHLSTLELKVARETRRRLSLEDEVRRLRDENRRLQDESHAAAQQLRRFTEWFFQTIDHQ